MLDHFAAQGTRVTVIETEWQAINPALRTNLDAFNGALQAGDDETLILARLAERLQQRVFEQETLQTSDSTGSGPGTP